MRSLRWALIQHDWCPYKKRKTPCEDRDTEKTPYYNRGRDGNDAAASQETPRIDGHHQKLGRGKEGFHPESQRDHSPADTLISDFWSPELEQNKFLFF